MKIPEDFADRLNIQPAALTADIQWEYYCESSFVLTLEAFRRFLDITEDARQAAGLTLAWASLAGGHAARPD